jgi:DNA-binding protein H-NS
MSKTYLQIAKEIEALQTTAKKLFAVEAKSAVARINQVIAKYGLTPEDLRFPAKPVATSTPNLTSLKAKSGTKAGPGAKFSDSHGNSWGGRGPRPYWLTQAIASGKSIESFATGTKKGTELSAVPTSPASVPSLKKRAQAKSIAPKYREPQTENTWTGRGSQPRWLKSALKKRGVRLEDFLIDKVQAPSTRTTAAAKTQKKMLAKAATAPAVKVATEDRTAKRVKAERAVPVSKQAPKARRTKPVTASEEAPKRASTVPAGSPREKAAPAVAPVNTARAVVGVRGKQPSSVRSAKNVSTSGSIKATAKRTGKQTPTPTKKLRVSGSKASTATKPTPQLSSTPVESSIESAATAVAAQPSA